MKILATLLLFACCGFAADRYAIAAARREAASVAYNSCRDAGGLCAAERSELEEAGNAVQRAINADVREHLSSSQEDAAALQRITSEILIGAIWRTHGWWRDWGLRW